MGWVLPGATPIQAGTCPWRCSGRCADAAVWQGSEEPGQLLLIKSQLWFLSGEPLSKDIRREAQRTCSFPSMTPTHLPGLPCTLPPPEPDEGPEMLAAQLLQGGPRSASDCRLGGSPERSSSESRLRNVAVYKGWAWALRLWWVSGYSGRQASLARPGQSGTFSDNDTVRPALLSTHCPRSRKRPRV